MLEIEDPTSDAAKNILAQLRQLCPEADFQMDAKGRITPKAGEFCGTAGDETKGKHPAACSCICQLIGSTNKWKLRGVRMDGTDGVWPNTRPDDSEKGSNGKGTGGVITAPTTDSDVEFDAYDPEGDDVTAPYHKVLGHELCGHAKHMDKGDHDPRPQPRGDRPGHNQAIDEENVLRIEQRMTKMRGRYGNPNRGESTSHKRKTE